MSSTVVNETDTVKNFGNNVLQPSIENFQYFNSTEVEDIRVVDGKDVKGLLVDNSTVYQELQKTLDDSSETFYHSCITSR